MIAIVHFIYSQSVHALALNAGSMDNDAGRYCNCSSLPHSNYQILHHFLKFSQGGMPRNPHSNRNATKSLFNLI